MGEVYLAQDTKLDRKVAIKLLPQESCKDERAKKRLIKEAKAAAKLDHQNICAIYEVGEQDGQSFIVLQYIDGETLTERIRKEPLEVGVALDISVQIADALAEAHSIGIIHRDIKPQNVMVTAKGQVKMLDFGLAKTIHGEQAIDSAGSESMLTAPGLLVGSVPYMSPEQARGEALDGRSDIFSFGVLLYEVLSGRHPFINDSIAATIASILMREPPALSEFRQGIPTELQWVVSKALEKDKTARYQTAEELIVDLKVIRQKLHIGLQGEGQPTVAVRPNARRSAKQEKNVANRDVTRASAKSTLSLPRSRKTHKSIRSLAIIPFVNSGTDVSMDYLSDGITESVINLLSQLPKLKVMARSTVFRYKGKDIDLQQVGRDLNVQAVLTGRVFILGNRLAIGTELVNVADGSQLWGEQYNRILSDIFTLQEEIAKEISEKLRLRLTGEEKQRLKRRYTENTEAYRLYLLGRYYWNKRDNLSIGKALEFFNKAVDIDSTYALAYAGLADCYVTLGGVTVLEKESKPRAEAAVIKALEIDDQLAEAHTSLANIRMRYYWDWSTAERAFERAIELNPNYATAYLWYAYLLAMTGRVEDALREIRKAQELDPLSITINTYVGFHLFLARRYDEALEQLLKTVDMDASFAQAHFFLGRIHEVKGRDVEALREFLIGNRLQGQDAAEVEMLKEAYELSGWKGYWQKELEFEESKLSMGYSSPVNIALCYLNMEDKEKTLEWLERGYEERSTWLTSLKTDPAFDPLRSDTRFQALLSRIGFPE